MSSIELDPVKIRAHRQVVKRLGPHTDARCFDVRASSSTVVLDLLLPELEPGPIEIAVDLDRTTLKLLVPDGAIVDHDEVRRVGRGGVKDRTGTSSPEGRMVRLAGEMRSSEIRVHRGGVAMLSLLGSTESRTALRRAHREGRL